MADTMTYTIHWSKQSEKFLDKLPIDTARRIVHKVNSIKEEPFHYIEHFEGESFFKLRIGDYRILLDIDTSKLMIEVRVLGHHKNIYKGK